MTIMTDLGDGPATTAWGRPIRVGEQATAGIVGGRTAGGVLAPRLACHGLPALLVEAHHDVDHASRAEDDCLPVRLFGVGLLPGQVRHA